MHAAGIEIILLLLVFVLDLCGGCANIRTYTLLVKHRHSPTRNTNNGSSSEMQPRTLSMQ